MFIDFSSLATSIGVGELATSIGIGGLATSIGIGGFLGFLMGYAIKKILKIIIIVSGLLVGIIYYLQYNGLIGLNWAKVEATVSSLMTNFDGLSLNAPFFPGIGDQIFNSISHSGIPLTGGFAAGFVFGVSKG